MSIQIVKYHTAGPMSSMAKQKQLKNVLLAVLALTPLPPYCGIVLHPALLGL
jgi:hypothetical protein